MTATQVDFTTSGAGPCEQGATFYRKITYKDSNGALVNLTGYSARMQVRQSYSSTSTLASLTSSGGDIVLGGALGTIEITISATATAAMPATVAVYDLELVIGSTVQRLMQGAFQITAEVTR